MKLIYVNDTNALKFDKENKQNITFAKYFSPTCPACVAMESEWDNMCKDIEQKYDTDLLLAQIDGNGMNKLEQTDTYSDVAYVPSLILLKNGQKVEEYNGPKKKDEMIEFLLKKGHIKPKMRGGNKLTRRGKRRGQRKGAVSRRGQRKGKKAVSRQRKGAVSRRGQRKGAVSRRGQRKGAVSRRGQRKGAVSRRGQRKGKKAVSRRGQRKTLRRGKKGAGPRHKDFRFIQNEKWLKPFLIALTKNIDTYSKNDNEPHQITSEEAEDFAIDNVDRVFRPTMLSSKTKNQYKYDWSKCPEKQQLDLFDDCRISQGFGNNIVPGARKFDPKYHLPSSYQNKKEKQLAENSYKYLKNMENINDILKSPSSDYTRFQSDKKDIKDKKFIEDLRNIKRTQKDSYRAILETYGYQKEVTLEELKNSLKETNDEIDETKLFINERMKQEPSVDDENRNSFFN